MKKFIKSEINPSRRVGPPFLAKDICEAIAIAFPFGVDDLGEATEEEIKQWNALEENDLPDAASIDLPVCTAGKIPPMPPVKPPKDSYLDYFTWKKVTEVQPPEGQPVWLKSPSRDGSWDYSSFIFYNLDDWKGCPDFYWLPIAGHDYGGRFGLADHIGGTEISFKDLGDVKAFNQKVTIEQVPAEPIDGCSVPYTTKIEDLEVSNLFKSLGEGEIEFVGDEPINVQITSTIAIEDAPKDPPAFQNKPCSHLTVACGCQPDDDPCDWCLGCGWLSEKVKDMKEYLAYIAPSGVPDSAIEQVKQHALVFAQKAHGDQVRKYNGEPYWHHPLAVARAISCVTDDLEMYIAALLHDVIEDTPKSYEDISMAFGIPVADLVLEVTDVSKPEDGNRATRKGIDRQHIAKASARGQTIKLADLIDNSHSIIEHDPKFSQVFMAEMKQLLEVLQKGDRSLRHKASSIVDIYTFK